MPQRPPAVPNLPNPPHWGARWLPDTPGIVQFSIWAPNAALVRLWLADAVFEMTCADGWFTLVTAAEPRMPYCFEIDGVRRPDPAARAQMGDVHGPSKLLPPAKMVQDWGGRSWQETVIYELHIGSFTAEGTYAACARELPRLADLGITAIELMPLSQFAGARGWGYDGVLIAAPHPSYGTPEELRALIAQAHRLGISVILDLVMNHFGPDGNYLPSYCQEFFEPDRQTPWGAAIDFSAPQVRAFFMQAALGWIADYGFDGLRLDAVHQICDPSPHHFLIDLCETSRSIDWGRPIHLITEDERNLPDLREAGFDAEWNDDYHHAIHCALTGENQGYYAPYAVDPLGDLAKSWAQGHVDQGQPRPAGATPRGAPSGHLPPSCFVNSNQTHDQIGNRALGDRLTCLAPAQSIPVIHAALLCAPFIPMLFMGEEVGSTAPFQFFCDFSGDLAEAIREGRKRELGLIGIPPDQISDPNAADVMALCHPFRGQSPERAGRMQELTRRALTLRRTRILPLIRSGLTNASVTRPDAQTVIARWSGVSEQLIIAMKLAQLTNGEEAQDSLTYLPDPISRCVPALSIGDFQRNLYALAVYLEPCE
ncbi:malto-oligosyltrehalose trehalohydrolase [Thioclava sp. SK-1]|uniref:malto-oligosyltrehalose trehalohydrolase n=1 Tax=Thioclava sp. SK-1 TaxID=1889770 RepID=UPI000825FE4B|nr:malto-oligosyltrehalose trehalohydrolase [Thioclava sp. SK-1]OCX63154.1 malto-oligosyltrehalose trehalohydrolase [Thioclava sp. SK-1]